MLCIAPLSESARELVYTEVVFYRLLGIIIYLLYLRSLLTKVNYRRTNEPLDLFFMDYLDTQLFGISKGLKHGKFSVPDIGDIVPASLMLHDLEGLQPVRCSYMNIWGCEHLDTCAEEINELGEAYYDRYFVKEEILLIFEGLGHYLLAGDFDKQYNFFQRVKRYNDSDYTWFYTVCKLLKVKTFAGLLTKFSFVDKFGF